jgi:hypothetical protein
LIVASIRILTESRGAGLEETAMGAFAQLPKTETSAPAAIRESSESRWPIRWTFAFIALVCGGFWTAAYFVARALF